MAELKTVPTGASVAAFVNAIEDEARRKDCRALMKMMGALTGKRPKMWGDSIVGYGRYHYTYASGREGDWFMTGFSPRKRDLSVYIMPDLSRVSELLARLGRHRTGACCLYLKRLDDVDRDVLRALLERCLTDLRQMYPCR